MNFSRRLLRESQEKNREAGTDHIFHNTQLFEEFMLDYQTDLSKSPTPKTNYLFANYLCSL